MDVVRAKFAYLGTQTTSTECACVCADHAANRKNSTREDDKCIISVSASDSSNVCQSENKHRHTHVQEAYTTKSNRKHQMGKHRE